MKVPVKKDSAGLEMSGEAFKRWRKALGMTQKDAAEALGLKRRVVQYYEKGERKGKSVEIPLTVRLACYALSSDVRDYAGLDEEGESVVQKSPPKPRKKPTKKAAAKADASIQEVAG